MYRLYLILFILLIFLTLDKIDLKIWKILSFSSKADIVFENYEESLGKSPSVFRRFIYRIITMLYPLLYPFVLLYIILLSNFKNKSELISFIINKPFAHPIFTMALHGSINLLDSDSCKKQCYDFHSKIFWDNLFNKYDVPTPKIHGSIDDGNVKLYNTYNNSECIIKPVSGGFGTGIQKFDQNNIPHTGKYIIQELIQTDGHYRLATGCNDLLNITYYRRNGDNIASNGHNNGQRYTSKCSGDICEFENVKTNKKIIINTKLIESAKRDALLMHKSLKDIDIIGWDIVISGDRYYFLEGNIFAGCVVPDDKEYARKAKKIINCVKI